VVRGGATVILSMGDGRGAARSIDEYLKTGVWRHLRNPKVQKSKNP